MLPEDNKIKKEVSDTKYIIFSDIDDTLYTNTIMTKKINHTHNLIQLIENKHVVFISARPEIALLRYLTKWRLMKDFNNFTLLMGSIATVFWYIFLYTLYLLTLKRLSYPLIKAQEYIGTKKIHKFREYLKENHKTLFSKQHMNCIIFMGDNLQGDEYIGRYIVTNMNNYVVYDDAKYTTMCIVLIRDAAKKCNFSNIIHNYDDYKNMFITGLDCNIMDVMHVIKHRIFDELNALQKLRDLTKNSPLNDE